MLYGLVGAHRTGKTTLAKAIAEDLSIEFIPTSITEMARACGFDPVAPMSLHDRVTLQYSLLEKYIVLLENTERPAILDRTPIDMAGYLLAEFDMQSHLKVDQEVLDAAGRYHQLCMDVCERYFDMLFVVPPLAEYHEEPGKPALNRAFQWHVQLLMEGVVARLRAPLLVGRITTDDFDMRREAAGETIAKRMNAHIDMRRSAAHIH